MLGVFDVFIFLFCF